MSGKIWRDGCVSFLRLIIGRRFSSDQSRTSGNNVNVASMLIETTVITVNYQPMCTENGVPCLPVNTLFSLFLPPSIDSLIAHSLPFPAHENYPPSYVPSFIILIFPLHLSPCNYEKSIRYFDSLKSRLKNFTHDLSPSIHFYFSEYGKGILSFFSSFIHSTYKPRPNSKNF